MYEAVQKDEMEQLPQGRHQLSREEVAESQRRRLLAGMARALAEHGFSRLTVKHVVASARVSRRTFYVFFDSKEECLCAAYDAASEALWRSGEEAVARADGWPSRVSAATAAALDFLAADTHRAHLFTIEARAAGEELAARQRADVERAAALLRAGREGRTQAAQLPDGTETTLVENIAALTGANVLSGAAEILPSLAPQLTEHLLSPYLGADEAKAVAGEGTSVQPADATPTRRISSAAA